MSLYSRRIRLWLWIATSAYLVVFFFDCIWSTSDDLADHTAYVNMILDNWKLSVVRDYGYPLPLYAHVVAAVFAATLSSPVAGVQLATLLSLVGVWSGFALMLQSLQRRMLLHVALASLVLLLLNRFFFSLELHGNEVIGGNFFFSHLVAQAGAVIVIAIALLTERQSAQPEQKYLVLVAAIPIVECLHLLPTFQLFGVLALLVATDFFVEPKQSRLKTLGIGALLTIVGAFSMVLHPAFAPSVRVSASQDANILLLRTPDIKTLAILCGTVGLLSALLLYKWLYSAAERRHGLAVKYIALYGMANSGLCLFQIFLYQLGVGGEYVCKKYAFALNTTLLLELALLIGLLNNPRRFKNNPENPALTAAFFNVAFMSLFILAAFFAVLPKEKVIDAAKLATIERFARMYTQIALNNPPGTFNYAVGLDFPASNNISSLINIGALKAPPPIWYPEPHGNTWDVYMHRPFSQPSLVAHILTSVNAKWDVPRCRTQFSSASAVVLDGQCVISALSKSECVGRVDFSLDGHVPLYAATGFDDPEESGSWTIEPKASFACQFPAGARKADRTVEITASGFSPSGKAQRVLLSVDDGPPKQYEFKEERTITIELSPEKDQLKLNFGLPDAVSPKQSGVSDDPRKLGIYVRSIRFGP